MPELDYAHNNTQGGERPSVTAQFVRLSLPKEIAELRNQAFARAIPTADDETLQYLLVMAKSHQPKRILELGTAIGISGCCLLSACPQATLVTVEKNPEFFQQAKQTFAELGYQNRVTSICGDAGEEIEKLTGTFDFIFLDSAKVQYVKYLPTLKKLLSQGGVLFADDVLLYGYVTGEVPTPPKRKMLVQHIREYIQAACADPELTTSVVPIGDGVCISIKN